MDRDGAQSTVDSDDYLTPVIDSRLEQLTTAGSGIHVQKLSLHTLLLLAVKIQIQAIFLY